MADTFTSLLRLVLQETGGNENVWGDINNSSLIQLLETAIVGRITVDVTLADVVLTTANGATDQARNAMLAITGNPGVARDITVPSTSKIYMVTNETSPAFDVTVKTSAGSGVVVAGGSIVFIYVDPDADETFLVGAGLPATETQSGVAEIATQAEVDAASDDTRIVTAFKLANATSLLQATETQRGALEIAFQAEVNTGTDTVRAVTPATLKSSVNIASFEAGSFTGTLTGMTGSVQGTFQYEKHGSIATIWLTSNLAGTSNSTAMTLTGLPAAITPVASNNVRIAAFQLLDNSLLQAANGVVNSSGVISFGMISRVTLERHFTSNFTASGQKGIQEGTLISWPVY